MLDRVPAAEVSLTQWIGQRACQHGDRAALTFVDDDGVSEQTWTYAQLWSHASSVARALASTGVRAIDTSGSETPRALLLFPPGLQFVAGFLGCQIAGWIPVPTCYPKPGRAMPRLDSAASDCRPQAILCDSLTAAGLDETRLCPEARSLHRIDTETAATTFAAEPAIAPHTLTHLHGDALALLM